MNTGLQKALVTTTERLSRCGILITPTGIKVTRELEFEEFGDAMSALLFLDDRFKVIINFGLGDLYNNLKLKHGEKRAQITDRWGEGWFQRLSALGGIAGRVPEKIRHGYSLAWHVYESAGMKSVPDDIRVSMLETAADYKRNGKIVKREDIRDSVAPYRTPRATAKPQFTSGLAKDAEDDGLPIAPAGVRRAEPEIFAGENMSTKTGENEDVPACPRCGEVLHYDGQKCECSADKAETQQTESYTTTVEAHEAGFAVSMQSSEDLSDLVPEGLEIQPDTCRLCGGGLSSHVTPDATCSFFLTSRPSPFDEIEALRAEVESLRAKLAGSPVIEGEAAVWKEKHDTLNEWVEGERYIGLRPHLWEWIGRVVEGTDMDKSEYVNDRLEYIKREQDRKFKQRQEAGKR